MNALSEFLGAAMVFVSQATGLPVPDVPPAITVAPHCDVQAAVGYDCSAGVQGFYVPNSDIVVMSDTHKDSDPTFYQSILIHEIVHYMQDKSGDMDKRTECELERQAYAVGISYLDYRGYPKDSPNYVGSVFSMLSYGDCRFIRGEPR